jgi:dihydrolipoamide dehydrogenase
MSEKLTTQLAVLGAGPGGYTAAFMAADLGLDVVLMDVQSNPGGVCLFRGCIPSKALLHIAKVIADAREAAYWGVHFSEPQFDLDKLRASTGGVVSGLTGGLGQLCKARGVRFLQGRASFEESQLLRVVADDGSETMVRCEKTILAAGSRPAHLPNLYIESPRLMNSTAALQLADIPRKLLVVGGGYIGLELGSVYATLGSRVTLIEMTGSLLPGADADLVEILAKRIEQGMDRVLLNTRVTGMAEIENGIQVGYDGDHSGEEVFDKVLVCIGRRPNSSGLGLKNTKIELDDHGFVRVDPQRRTTDPAILAVGDIAGEPMLAHKASHEGRVAAETAAGYHVAFEPRAIPAVVFTDPEVAWCGVTENEVRKTGRPVHVARFPWGASGRAKTINRGA